MTPGQPIDDAAIAALAKVELHVHLDCCLSYEAVCRLRPGMDREEYRRRFVAPPRCRDLADFLRVIDASLALLQDENGLRLAVADLFDQLARDSVIYAEIRFAPLLHLEAGLTPGRVVAAVLEEADRQSSRRSIESRLILCTLRHFSEEQSLSTVALVESFAGTRVAALDLAADEAHFPLQPHISAFRRAAERGIGLTAHAGEAAGAASVRETLERLRPGRVGHGVRSVEDPELLNELRRNRVHLEVCPSCNLQTGIFPSLADHPVDRLFRAGVSLGVNTDARTVTGVSLVDEYRRLRDGFDWGADHFRACNRRALEAAFLDDRTRAALLQRLEENDRH